MTPVRFALYTVVTATAATLLLSTPATGEPRRLSDSELKQLAERIEQDSNRFKKSLEEGIDESPMDGTWEEDEIEDYVENFEKATDRLEDRLKEGSSAPQTVQEVLQRATVIDGFVMDRPVGTIAQNDWTTVRSRLEELANAYAVTWQWRWGGATLLPEAHRLNDDEMERIIKRIEENTDRFKDSLDDGLERSALDGTQTKKQAEALVEAFEKATDRLRDRFDDSDQASNIVGRVLWEASRIDGFVMQYDVGSKAKGDWETVRTGLRELARGYGVEPR